MTDRLVDVALPLPLQRAFTYRVPEELPLPPRGARVLVPFGRRRSLGVALGAPDTPPAVDAELKQVIDGHMYWMRRETKFLLEITREHAGPPNTPGLLGEQR